MHDTNWVLVLLILNAAYFYTHYFFASGNAQIAALYAVFLGVGINLDIPAAPMALMLAFTSSLYCSLTQYTHARGPFYLVPVMCRQEYGGKPGSSSACSISRCSLVLAWRGGKLSVCIKPIVIKAYRTASRQSGTR